MLNAIWMVIVAGSVLLAAYTGNMEALTRAILDDAKVAVELAIKLVGVMALFLGVFKVAEDGGLLRAVARRVSPVMRLLFPGVPADHPAMSAMILNIASNMLGLGNAATPFGIRAVEELDKLNAEKGTATNAMALFLAINTAGLALLPSGVIGIRAALGSTDPAGILLPTWVASGSATIVAITTAFLLSRMPVFRRSEPSRRSERAEGAEAEVGGDVPDPDPILWRRIAFLLYWVLFAVLVFRRIRSLPGDPTLLDVADEIASFWMLPAIIVGTTLFGWSRGVRVYESLVEGAKQGFDVALRIIPFLVAIIVMSGMFRASGGMALLVGALGPITERIGMPAEAVPMAILRPLTGSGALGVMSEVMETHGPDSFLGYLVSTLQGSTDTTFYVIAVYFGAVRVVRVRHTLVACLAADLAGILAAVAIVNALFG